MVSPLQNLQVILSRKILFFSMVVVSILVLTFFERKTPPSPSASPTSNSKKPEFRAIVLPHHDLILGEFPQFYESIPRRDEINQIILLSPNHFEPESSVVKVKGGNFTDLAGVVIDEAVFHAEHGVSIHLPFINHYFKNVSVTPILFTRKIAKQTLEEIIIRILETAQANTLILVSIDFSHGLVYAEAEKKDQEMLQLIQESQADVVLKLGDEYLDCPACLYIFLRLAQGSDVPFKQIFHGNSYAYLPLRPNDATTSYFVLLQ